MIVEFTDDQLMAVLDFLEQQRDAEYSLEDVIEGIKDGTFTRPISFTSESK